MKELHPAVLQRWPLEFAQHVADTTVVPSSPAVPPGCCLLYFIHHFCLIVIIGMPNRNCMILDINNVCDIISLSKLFSY